MADAYGIWSPGCVGWCRANETIWGRPSDSAFGHWALFYVPTNALAASVVRDEQICLSTAIQHSVSQLACR